MGKCCSSRSITIGVFVFGMLLSGTLNTIAANIQNKAISVGIHGTATPFQHAYVQTFFMFVGESLCLFALAVQMSINRRRRKELELQNTYTNKPPKVCSQIFVMPMMCDLTGSTLGGIGLIYLSMPSVWQMLRGARIIFSSILTVIFLKRTLFKFHFLGIATVVLGLIGVGLSQYFSENKNGVSTEDLAIGITVTLVGQLFSSAQMVVEELYVRDREYPPLNIVGMEGLWGIVITGGVVLPAIYFIPQDNSKIVQAVSDNALDAIVQISNSWVLQLFISLYVFSIAFFNFFGVALTKHLSAVHRTLLDTLRTISIWAVDLFIFYVIPSARQYGEQLTEWSLLQAGGFVLLCLGTLIYNEIIKIPGMEYPPSTQDPDYSISDMTTKTLLKSQINTNSFE